jgi:hypothetical protein
MAEANYDFDLKRTRSRACNSDCYWHFLSVLNSASRFGPRFQHMAHVEDRRGDEAITAYFDQDTSVGIVVRNPNDYPKAPNVSIYASSERKARAEGKILVNLTRIVLSDDRFRDKPARR